MNALTRAARPQPSGTAILDTAAEVFATRGFASARLDDIAHRLGLTRQGLLHYHPSKQALFRAVLERDRHWAARSTEVGIDPTNPLSSLRRFLGADGDSRERVRLQQVLQGEAIGGNDVALDYVRQRREVVTADVHRRVLLLAEHGRLAAGWTIATATTMLVALINGSQALALIDDDVDVTAAFDTAISLLLTERIPS